MKLSLIARAAAAVALGASCLAASALPVFTLNPTGGGLAGTSFTADNLIVTDFSTVLINGTSFSESGYLPISAAQLGGSIILPTGLNSTYGLYIDFSGVGTMTGTTGSFTSLNYTLYGYNGTATFGFSGNTPTESATSPIALATGSLMSGAVSTASGVPTANATLSFNVVPAEQGFFAAPVPFYNVALTAFTNTTSEVEAFNGGFRIRQGGGAINFVSTVPEPETYAMMFAGLAAMGFVARRRNQAK